MKPPPTPTRRSNDTPGLAVWHTLQVLRRAQLMLEHIGHAQSSGLRGGAQQQRQVGQRRRHTMIGGLGSRAYANNPPPRPPRSPSPLPLPLPPPPRPLPKAIGALEPGGHTAPQRLHVSLHLRRSRAWAAAVSKALCHIKGGSYSRYCNPHEKLTLPHSSFGQGQSPSFITLGFGGPPPPLPPRPRPRPRPWPSNSLENSECVGGTRPIPAIPSGLKPC